MVTANNLRVMNSPRVNRKTRSPQHTWAIKQRPFVITPFMIAPVLPGETLKAGVMQARAVSEPLNASRFASITGMRHLRMTNIEHVVFQPPSGNA